MFLWILFNFMAVDCCWGVDLDQIRCSSGCFDAIWWRDRRHRAGFVVSPRTVRAVLRMAPKAQRVAPDAFFTVFYIIAMDEKQRIEHISGKNSFLWWVFLDFLGCFWALTWKTPGNTHPRELPKSAAGRLPVAELPQVTREILGEIAIPSPRWIFWSGWESNP